MFQLGEWLEKYLEPGITSKEYMELGYSAKKYYKLDFETTEDDLSFQIMRILDSYPKKLNVFEDFMELFVYFLEPYIIESTNKREEAKSQIQQNIKPGIIQNILLSITDLYKNFETLLENDKKDWMEKGDELPFHSLLFTSFELNHTIDYPTAINGLDQFMKFTLYDFIFLKFRCINLLSIIQSSPKEWTDTLDTICKRHSAFISLTDVERYEEDGAQLLNSWLPTDEERITPYSDQQIFNITNYLIEGYSATKQSVYIEKGHFKTKNALSGNYHWFTKFTWPQSETTYTFPSIFPWGVVVSKMFLDFLNLGGQKHIIFCKYCGRFSLSKRLKPDGSPEKIFCSDICRTAYKRV